MDQTKQSPSLATLETDEDGNPILWDDDGLPIGDDDGDGNDDDYDEDGYIFHD